MEKKPVISQEEFRQQYSQRRQLYERLATNLQQALKAFLQEHNISYLEVLTRVKDADSAYEKIARKGYEQPFEQIEDWCGLRIICYYPSDIDRICEVLKEEFAVQTQEDTAQRLASNEFGYRSTHFILQVKPSWAVTPNYRGLQELKAEVQVRTILMHAWAEIEHKLAYKSTEQAPDKFRRKLSRLSAKFEEADEQFEELRNGIIEYKATIRQTVKTEPAFRDQELNLDTLQAFLSVAFPKYKQRLGDVTDLLEDLISMEMDLGDLVNAWETVKPSVLKLNKLTNGPLKRFSSIGLLRFAMDVMNNNYYMIRHPDEIPLSERKDPWSKAVFDVRIALGISTETF